MNKNFIKGAGVLLIAVVMILSAITVSANTRVSKPMENRDIVFEDGFETYDDFSIDFPPWTLVDVDGGQTYGFGTADWPNEYSAQAYIIFNPSATSPPVTDPGSTPHGGDKYAACFATVPPPYNDDWLITPQINSDSFDELIFWAKSYTATYGLERMKVGISTTGTNPADFTIISSGPYESVPTSWTEYTYDISSYSGNIYIGINCISQDAFFLMIDDMQITGDAPDDTTPPETTIELDGDMQGADYISDVTVTLSATDDLSGVAATYIKVDDGVYEEYTDPVVVSGLGSHTVYYYSEDNAGNEEDEKSETFDIVEEILEPDISIKSIDGGTGITAVIENTGEGDATDVEWTITIEGGFFILTKEATDVIESIEAGDEAEITMSVFGIGLGIITDMPVITVEAECAEGSSDDDSVEAQIILSKVTIQD